uniref:Uncharacterized protein n=1 Tax=Arundo donax TaxID=35708 RepID=A0A0A8YTG4_ARUDO
MYIRTYTICSILLLYKSLSSSMMICFKLRANICMICCKFIYINDEIDTIDFHLDKVFWSGCYSSPSNLTTALAVVPPASLLLLPFPSCSTSSSFHLLFPSLLPTTLHQLLLAAVATPFLGLMAVEVLVVLCVGMRVRSAAGQQLCCLLVWWYL